MHEWIKEHDMDIPFSQTQTLAVSEHANKTGHYPLWDEVKLTETVTGSLEDFILTPSTGGSGIEIPEAWIPTITQHNSRSQSQRTSEESVSSSDNTSNALDQKSTNNERGM